MSTILEGPSADKLPHHSAEDWGIESDDSIEDLGTSGSETDSDDKIHGLKSPAAEPPIVYPRSLKLGKNHHSYTQHVRFRSMLRSLLNQRVKQDETNRFVEQYQFAIISSGLLEAQPIYSCWSVPDKLRPKSSLTFKDRPWTKLYVHRIASFGGPATLSALVYYLHLRYRSSSLRYEKEAVALIIFISIFVYMWATRKRRLVRIFRAKALMYFDLAVQSAKCLDGDMVRATKKLQELELCANGFGINSLPNFVSNDHQFREKSEKVSAGRKYRSQLASALMLIFNSYRDALQECFAVADPKSFRKYETLYCLPEARKLYGVEIQYDTMSINYTKSEFFELSESFCCLISITKFKRLLQELHFVRRLFLCTLVAINMPPSLPTATECHSWEVIIRHLSHLHNLSKELSNLLSKDSFERFSVRRPINNSVTAKPLLETVTLMNHLSARLEILDESYTDSPKYDSEVNTISAEIDELKAHWEAFLRARTEKSSSDAIKPQLGGSAYEDTRSVTAFENISNISSQPPTELDTYVSYNDHDDAEFLVFEGEAPLSLNIQSGKLTREQRIASMRENRSSPKAQDVDLGIAFAQELSQVMTSRKSAIKKC